MEKLDKKLLQMQKQILEDEIFLINKKLELIELQKLEPEQKVTNEPSPSNSGNHSTSPELHRLGMGEIQSMESWVGKGKVLVQTTEGANRSDFYIVDLKCDMISKLPSVLFYHGLSGSTVVLDSSVYAIGGMYAIDLYEEIISKRPKDLNPDVDHVHSGTSVLKLMESPSKWTQFTEMNYARWYPACATLGDKIYAFGGSKTGNPIAEVFDTKIGKWGAITPPTDDGRDWSLSPRNITYPVISDPENNRLLVHFGVIPALYAYYPNSIANDKWECLDRNMRFHGNPAEVVDDVIYFFIPSGRHCSILAYDIPTKEWLKVSWSSRFGNPSIFCDYMKRMFHLGNGMLCLADSYHLHGDTILEFTRFRVERIDPGEVRVTPTSVHSFPVEACRLGSCFVPL